ncbi:protein FAR1-RELATED SEQUENCE 5-like [Carya illinoinensis]|uniref:protein FAR1-RELATED SEQUENCE 5-like n=1 Tax=Carya illinoinensis TaxID=32201 RepID=UPI001C71CB99|nr:protein FAR1-RELATED SEQUENCE 5-like [Carya illinoinensis]
MTPPRAIINTSSATSARVGDRDTRICLEIEEACSSAKVDEENIMDRSNEIEIDDGTTGTPQVVPSSDGDDIIEEPNSGMEFNSFDELLSYYKHYAKKNGFGVMTQRSERSEDQSVRYVTLGCARGGKARNKSLNVANPRPTRKTDCKARINALRVEGKMRLTTVYNTHNHGLSPKKSRFFRCNRDVSETVKRVLDTNDIAGIRLNKSYGSLVVGAGGFENLPFLEKDCRNYIHKARHLRLGAGGAGALRDYFMRMQFKNNGFFALMDLDDDGRLKNVFWSNPRSRAAYQYFGDVCMDGISPKVIITDQDRAMKNAIALIFPETRHRFCLWHILKKVPEKLGSYAAYKSGLKTGLMKCVYDTQSIEDFEKCWAEFINTFELHENAWLNSLYAERDHWVPVFLKETFWAGMSTTQRSESMNAFFDGYVHSKTNLKEFVDQFDSALKKKIENENQAEFQSFSVTIPCVSRSPIEKKFQELYTNAKFKEVQQQVIGVLDLETSLLTSDGVLKSYLVEDEVRIQEFTKSLTYSVELNVDDCNAKCSCGLFQMRGILCRHILAIFKSNGIKSLPDRYILDRWRKDIKRRYTLIRSSYDEGELRPNGNRYPILLNMCYTMIDYAVDCNEHFEDAKKRIHEMTECYRQNQRPISFTESGGLEMVVTTAVGSSQQVKSPNVVRGKGRPPSLRRASRMETELSKVKAKQSKAQVGGKRKHNHRDEGDTTAKETRRNLFGPIETPIFNVGNFQIVANSAATDICGTQFGHTVFGTQETVRLVGGFEILEEIANWVNRGNSRV